MRFAFTAEQLQIRDAVREALASACPPGVVRAAWSAPDASVLPVLAELGVLGINAPPEVGGLGLGALDQVLVLEEAGRAAAPIPLIEILALNPTLVELGEVDLLSRIVAGEALATVASEAGLALDADRAAAVFQLQGASLLRCVSPSLTLTPEADGSRRRFRLSGGTEPTPADGEALQLRLALGAAATSLGLARWMLDAGVSYAKDRRQFGKPIGSFQAVQHHLVEALQRLAFAAPLVYRAAWSLDVHHPNRAVHVSMAKLAATEAAQLTARKVLQVHGAIGYTFEYDLHLWMKRAWSLAACWGDARWHLDRVGAFVLSGGEDA